MLTSSFGTFTASFKFLPPSLPLPPLPPLFEPAFFPVIPALSESPLQLPPAVIPLDSLSPSVGVCFFFGFGFVCSFVSFSASTSPPPNVRLQTTPEDLSLVLLGCLGTPLLLPLTVWYCTGHLRSCQCFYRCFICDPLSISPLVPSNNSLFGYFCILSPFIPYFSFLSLAW